MMTPGLAAIFGPHTSTTANHIQSMAEAFQVPHIETRWDYNYNFRQYSINIHPHPAILSKVMLLK